MMDFLHPNMEALAKIIIVFSLALLVSIVSVIQLLEWRRRRRAAPLHERGTAARQASTQLARVRLPVPVVGTIELSGLSRAAGSQHLRQPIETLNALYRAVQTDAERIRLSADIGLILEAWLALAQKALISRMEGDAKVRFSAECANWSVQRARTCEDANRADASGPLGYNLAFIRETGSRIDDLEGRGIG
ncbi:MAG: hypothetical protein U1E83_07530 [Methylotetracoccus sp.]